jgi:hypothetical protein
MLTTTLQLYIHSVAIDFEGNARRSGRYDDDDIKLDIEQPSFCDVTNSKVVDDRAGSAHEKSIPSKVCEPIFRLNQAPPAKHEHQMSRSNASTVYADSGRRESHGETTKDVKARQDGAHHFERHNDIDNMIDDISSPTRLRKLLSLFQALNASSTLSNSSSPSAIETIQHDPSEVDSKTNQSNENSTGVSRALGQFDNCSDHVSTGIGSEVGYDAINVFQNILETDLDSIEDTSSISQAQSTECALPQGNYVIINKHNVIQRYKLSRIEMVLKTHAVLVS